MRTVYYSLLQAPVGDLLIAATEKGMCRLQLSGALPPPQKDEVWVESPHRLRRYEEQLRKYFQRQLREFDCEFDLRGTPFQKRCWEALQRIPYGKTCTYAELARAVGLPRASRAVGQANHRNPVAIIIPCHRVIGADGSLTGYGGGLEMKRALLRLEGVALFQDEFNFVPQRVPNAKHN
ncbi:MAG TPA: methylated-DNA--[protein]-cysteine S-methyltransferase [Terriglobales bacterium]|nr:methylated-DNA--[protein]-cysteine S-methyltransferase [Terriglobales bacterium]